MSDLSPETNIVRLDLTDDQFTFVSGCVITMLHHLKGNASAAMIGVNACRLSVSLLSVESLQDVANKFQGVHKARKDEGWPHL